MKRCSNCNTNLPEEARFCFQCGERQDQEPKIIIDPGIDLGGDLNRQVMDKFFLGLQQKVREELQPDTIREYTERVYESGFRETVQRRGEQMADKINRMKEDPEQKNRIARYLDQSIDELTDFFIIRHCSDLYNFILPEAILQYQGLNWTEINLFSMILDYLDFDREEETIYTDFLVMPVDQLRNAGKFFLFPEKNEKILLICDQSMFGACREGFALTELGLYWKAHLQTARKVHFHKLKAIKREKDWLTINGHFFNSNPGLNVKMMKLLKKIRFLVN